MGFLYSPLVLILPTFIFLTPRLVLLQLMLLYMFQHDPL